MINQEMREFKFRILLDNKEEDDIFRDVVIREDQSFEDLHNFIVKGFSFRGDQMASFYMSNDSWDKGEELSLMDMTFGAESSGIMMNATKVSDKCTEVGNKLLYVYDFLKMWIFYVEVLEINESANKEYPEISLSYGVAPSEDSKEIDFGLGDYDPEEDEKNNEFSYPDDDLFGDIDNEFGGMENIDDLNI